MFPFSAAFLGFFMCGWLRQASSKDLYRFDCGLQWNEHINLDGHGPTTSTNIQHVLATMVKMGICRVGCGHSSMTLLSLSRFPRHGLLLRFCFSVLPYCISGFCWLLFFSFSFCSWMRRAIVLRMYAGLRDGMGNGWNVCLNGREG